MRRGFASLLASLAVAAIACTATAIRAEEGGCAHCGCKRVCRRVCRLVVEEKKVNVTCWGCKAEDFCVPGPSEQGCRHCEVCRSCPPEGHAGDVCAKPKTFGWTEWIPGCSAKIYTRRKLMRKIVTRNVPSYRWVVEDLCDQCEAHCGCAEVQPGADVPPPPVADAKLRHGAATLPPPPAK